MAGFHGTQDRSPGAPAGHDAAITDTTSDDTASGHALVAAADSRAARAGAAILRAGGNAADAAVAAGTVMAVTNPQLGDLGGDLFAVVHRPGEDVAALCAAGRAGSGADAFLLRAAELTSIPFHGDIRAVTVPGAVDGWLELHARYGRLPLEQVLEPAVTLAATGFPVGPLLAEAADDVINLPGADDLAERALSHRGHLPVGTNIRRPGVASVLGLLPGGGRRSFYLGPFGEGLIELGLGLFTRSDLARSQAGWMPPLSLRAWGHDLYTTPPPSQGYLTLAGAAVAAQLPLPDDPEDSAWVHLLAEASRAVGRDRPAVLYDGADGAALLDEDRLAGRRAEVDPEKAGQATLAGTDGDTTAICAVDVEGMGVSMVQSNAGGWGARIVEPETGIFLHNRGAHFTLEPGHPAELRAGARPPHTLAPALATTPAGDLRATVATMGGDAQPQILLQIMARLLAGGADPGPAVHAPRWLLGTGGFTTWADDGPAQVRLETDAPDSWADGLEERGHRVVRAETHPDSIFGHAQAIVRGEDGVHGAADPRALDGATFAV